MRKNIGERIKKFRKAANLKQSELAELIGVTNRAVSNWEAGNNGVDVELIPELCKALHISPNELLNTPVNNELTQAALEFARAFDSLSATGKELVCMVMNFAKTNHAATPVLGTEDAIIVHTKRMPVITGVMDGTIETEYAAKQEVRELESGEELSLVELEDKV